MRNEFMEESRNTPLTLNELNEEVDANSFIGQHFLKDNEVLEEIVRQVADSKNVVEIGAGPATLTDYLLRHGHRVTSYEIDTRFTDILMCRKNEYGAQFNIEWKNFLDIEPRTLNAEEFALVGNIPYHISEPLMFLMTKLNFDLSVLLMGKRFANTITATPTSPYWSRMSMVAKAYFDTDILREVPRQSFEPVPHADGALVTIVPKSPKDLSLSERAYRAIVEASETNTTIAKALKGLSGSDTYNSYSVDYKKGAKKARNRHSRRMSRVALRSFLEDYNHGEMHDFKKISTVIQGSTSLLELVRQSGIDEYILSKPLSGISNQDVKKISLCLSSIENRLRSQVEIESGEL